MPTTNVQRRLADTAGLARQPAEPLELHPQLANSLVRFIGVGKTYEGAQGPVQALQGIDLTIERGEVFGIIGRSGAGKSSLIRTINRLEQPSSGRVLIDQVDIGDFDEDRLVALRRRIGMIFQHFNLMSAKTVWQNVELPLKVAGVPQAERWRKVGELLELVGLQGKRDAYPAQLSGGQKQRVGIARALATRPQILLCDEATSALDPETTHDILGLIRSLRDKLDLTVLLITHEMAVVKEICDRVAVMEAGQVLEQGRVFEVFTRPAHPTTRSFVAGTIGHSVPPGTVARLPAPRSGEEQRLLQVLFAGPNSTRAVISEASRRFGIDLDIISGRIDEIAGEPFGLMALAAYGAPAQLDEAVGWFEELGLSVTPLAEVA